MKNEFRTNRLLSKRQQLIHACWNGMAPKILPECFDVSVDKPMILWGINNGNTFIDLEFGDFIQVLDKTSSVNPYVFMQVQEYN